MIKKNALLLFFIHISSLAQKSLLEDVNIIIAKTKSELASKRRLSEARLQKFINAAITKFLKETVINEPWRWTLDNIKEDNYKIIQYLVQDEFFKRFMQFLEQYKEKMGRIEEANTTIPLFLKLYCFPLLCQSPLSKPFKKEFELATILLNQSDFPTRFLDMFDGTCEFDSNVILTIPAHLFPGLTTKLSMIILEKEFLDNPIRFNNNEYNIEFLKRLFKEFGNTPGFAAAIQGFLAEFLQFKKQASKAARLISKNMPYYFSPTTFGHMFELVAADHLKLSEHHEILFFGDILCGEIENELFCQEIDIVSSFRNGSTLHECKVACPDIDAKNEQFERIKAIAKKIHMDFNIVCFQREVIDAISSRIEIKPLYKEQSFAYIAAAAGAAPVSLQ